MRNTKKNKNGKTKPKSRKVTRKSRKKQLGGEDYDEKLKIAREKQNEILELHKKIAESLAPYTKPSASIPQQTIEVIDEPIDTISTEAVKYWEKYFSQNELVQLRKQINEVNACGIITEKVPIFFKEELDETFHKYYCMVFIIIGILSKKLKQYCDIVIKGGKAIQLVTSGKIEHKSNDIDIVIYCKGDPSQKKNRAHDIAINIAEFIKWINPHLVSIDIVRDTASIVKVSLDVDSLHNTSSGKRGHKKAILDINYDAEYLPFLVSKRFIQRKIKINGIEQELLFIYADIDVQINELIYHTINITYRNKINPFNPEFHSNNIFTKKAAQSVNALIDSFIKINNDKYTKPELIENHTNAIYTIIKEVHKDMDDDILFKSMESVKQLLIDPDYVEPAPEPIQFTAPIARQKRPLSIIDPQTGKPIVPKN